MNEGTAREFWTAVAEVLRDRIPTADYFSWFAKAEPVSLSEQGLTLSFANDFAVRWVQERFAEVLASSLQQVAGVPVPLRVVSRETAGDIAEQPTNQAHETVTEEQLRAAVGTPPAQQQAGSEPARSGIPSVEDLGVTTLLNERYRFETFIIGEANQIAHAAALAVAEMPGQSYNPLFIHGGTGLGKTHLLHAIGQYVMDTRPDMRIAYVTTEQFVNRFIQALQRRDSSRDRFKEYFRGIDLLLMDDVQFLSGKGSALQEELFHTFNTLHEAGKQVVLTSDRAPASIPQLEDRLRSRFVWGLITDIETPDQITRVAILRKKAQADRLAVPTEVLDLIAQRVTTNVRELEGALTRVVATASFSGRPVTIEDAAQALANFGPSGGEPVTIERIQHVVCEHFRLSPDELVGKRRSNDVARPRQIAMYLSRVLLSAPSTQVGKRFGGRDHTTVLHAEKRIEDLIKEDREVYDVVEQLTATIRAGAAGGVQHAR